MPAGRFPPPAAAPAPKAPAPKARAQAAPVDPLAPLTGAEIANRIAGYTATLPAPLTEAQIQGRAQGMIDPVVARLTKSATDRGAAASGAISGYANSLANSLANYGSSARSIYSSAEQAQASADAAESGAVRGTGTELAGQLAAKIAQLQGGPGLDAATSGVVSANAAGGANATLGTGSAALAQLLARGTAAQHEAALQPGLARSQGMADIRDVTLAGNKTLADQVATATGQLPTLVSGLRDQSTTRSSNRAQAAQQLRQYLEGRNVDIAKFKEAEAAAGLTAQTRAAATTQAAATRAAATTAATAAKDAKPNAALSRASGVLVDANGNPIPGPDGKQQVLPGFKTDANGQVVKATAGKTPASTAKARQSAVTSASSTAIGILSKASSATATNPATGEKHKVSIAIGTPAYNAAINRAVAAVADALSPYMTHQQIVQYVQAKAKAFFAPPKKAPVDRNPATNPSVAGPPAP